MTKIIKYIVGFPLNIKPRSRIFENFKKIYQFKKEKVDVWAYSGPFTREDFDALHSILTSEQYFNLKNITLRNRSKILSLVKESIFGNLQLTNKYHKEQLKSLPETSENFLPTLEELLDHKDSPLCWDDAQRYLLEQAKKSGLHVPISFSYYYENMFEDLTYNKKVLVFINNILEGKVTLRKTGQYNDPRAGYFEEGKIKINVLGQEKRADWNSWQGNSLRWIVDPKIRKGILKEKEEGIIFIRL